MLVLKLPLLLKMKLQTIFTRGMHKRIYFGSKQNYNYVNDAYVIVCAHRLMTKQTVKDYISRLKKNELISKQQQQQCLLYLYVQR